LVSATSSSSFWGLVCFAIAFVISAFKGNLFQGAVPEAEDTLEGNLMSVGRTVGQSSDVASISVMGV